MPIKTGKTGHFIRVAFVFDPYWHQTDSGTVVARCIIARDKDELIRLLESKDQPEKAWSKQWGRWYAPDDYPEYRPVILPREIIYGTIGIGQYIRDARDHDFLIPIPNEKRAKNILVNTFGWRKSKAGSEEYHKP